jgi:DNA-directed RNA polymerase specialized sigma24 family protein
MLSAHTTAREDRALNPVAFNRLLSWLDDGQESCGETYLEMRRRLVAYFDRRNRQAADDLADETLNRVARTLETDGVIETSPPARYCYVVARFVLLEDIRRARNVNQVSESWGLDAAAFRDPKVVRDEETIQQEQRLDCLDRCLQELKAEQRELVLEYYRDTKRQKIERRQALAKRLGISMNALAIRASRIRAALQSCVSGGNPGD